GQFADCRLPKVFQPVSIVVAELSNPLSRFTRPMREIDETLAIVLDWMVGSAKCVAFGEGHALKAVHVRSNLLHVRPFRLFEIFSFEEVAEKIEIAPNESGLGKPLFREWAELL